MRRDATIGQAIITRWLSILSIVVVLLFPGTAWPISYRLQVLTDPPGLPLEEFTGTEEVVGELPRLAVTHTSATNFSAAEAAPFRVHSVTTSTTSRSSDARASFIEVPIRFDDNQALRDLIAPGGAPLELLLNFQASARTVGPEDPTTRRQGHAVVNAALGATSLSPASLIFAQHTIGNLPRQSGFFVGLAEDGGDVTIPFPIGISPFRDNGLEVLVFGTIFNQAFGSFFTAEGEIALPNRPESITLPDGTSASSLGIAYTFLPTVTPPDGNAVIPEPASLVLLASGLSVLAFTRRKLAERKVAI